MAKSFFLLLISGLLSVIWTPEFLMADDFELKKQPEFHAVETVEKPATIEVAEVEPASEVVRPAVAVQNVAKPTPAPAQATPVNYTVAKPNSISIIGKNLDLVEVANSGVDAGTHVNKFRKMFYGHNSPAVFQNLGSASEFSVTLGGVTTRYRVMEQHIFDKHSATQLSLNGQVYSMASLVNNAWGYDVILVTCAGQSLGNGDATQRLVLFANEI